MESIKSCYTPKYIPSLKHAFLIGLFVYKMSPQTPDKLCSQWDNVKMLHSAFPLWHKETKMCFINNLLLNNKIMFQYLIWTRNVNWLLFLLSWGHSYCHCSCCGIFIWPLPELLWDSCHKDFTCYKLMGTSWIGFVRLL